MGSGHTSSVPVFVRRLGIAVVIAGFLMAALEGVLRIARFEYRRPNPIIVVPLWNTADQSKRERLYAMYRFHPYWFWEPRPGARVLDCEHERINSAGSRGPGRPQAPERGAVRVAILGDSISFGMGVCWDDTYAALLERELSNVEVLNFGVTGFSAFQGEKLFEGRVLAYHPQIALVAFGAVDELLPATGHDVEAKFRVTSGASPTAVLWHDRLSALRMFQFLDRAFGRRPQRAIEAKAHENWASFSRGARDYLRNQSVPSFERSLARIVELGRSQGVRVVLIGPPRQTKVETRWPWAIEYTAAIERVASRLGVPYWDVRAAFRAVPDSDARLFLDDYHPNVAGHRLYARVLAERIRPHLGDVEARARDSGPRRQR